MAAQKEDAKIDEELKAKIICFFAEAESFSLPACNKGNQDEFANSLYNLTMKQFSTAKTYHLKVLFNFLSKHVETIQYLIEEIAQEEEDEQYKENNQQFLNVFSNLLTTLRERGLTEDLTNVLGQFQEIISDLKLEKQKKKKKPSQQYDVAAYQNRPIVPQYQEGKKEKQALPPKKPIEKEEKNDSSARPGQG